MPLTDTAIRNAKPGDKPRKISDGRGLYLEVAPSGGKWWRLKYRHNGKEKRISLGVYPEVSLQEARKRRETTRSLIANGIDPSEHRQNQKLEDERQTANGFEQIAREWYEQQKPSWTADHAITVIRRLEVNVFPWLGAKTITDISAPELLTCLRRVESRGAIETAHRVLSICSQVWRYAIATGNAERNIAADLRGALRPVKTRHYPTVTEPARIGELLRMFDGYHGTLTVRCALRLAPLVFQRPGELRQLEWSQLDLDAGEWRFTASKDGPPHIVPLARQALEILNELKPLTGRGRYVFAGARSASRPMSENTVNAAYRRMGITGDELVGHGLRAMARTVLDEELGFRPDFIEQQLAHAVRDPLGRAYNRTTHLAERHKMMQAWADYLDKLKAGTAQTR